MEKEVKLFHQGMKLVVRLEEAATKGGMVGRLGVQGCMKLATTLYFVHPRRTT